MLSAAPWPRLASLQAPGPSNTLPRRALVARALATNAAAVQKLLKGRSWLAPDPAVPVMHVRPEGSASGFAVIRDDLTHPLIGGNKWRKLDGLWPLLEQASDIVTCGGLQSAHTLAVAAAAAQHGKRAHLLVRGERPAVPTGSHLYARMLAHRVVYVAWLAGSSQSPLSDSSSSNGGSGDTSTTWRLVVDSGTGATATGLALGATLLGLPWQVTGVMLADTQAYYEQQQRQLVADFCQDYRGALRPSSSAAGAAAAAAEWEAEVQSNVAARLTWVPRLTPRKFGKVLPGEVARCQAVAQRHGILLDPIWNLAAWEVAAQLAAAAEAGGSGERVAMLHTGGHLGLCGLAQRWPDQF
ncbi:D-cysteine desulfhydrase mitochondrial [Chlorella sorokiniana]|uniref:D-cysteine desulfhydrase mitochondrial n=1 Tax=Chlorella sorokiniana TaxID=3076 RepID=A0A2P6TIN2_CHLSO|nr:D-cysteine desulfhydrase mitochondrial [Chlorella sorokiniana]|eukprot:PRW39108.1 D-cysteine desulfhydrase mitochondrial [Chlorella sorokiniana]